MSIKVDRNEEGIVVIPDCKLDTNGSADLQNVIDKIFNEEANAKITVDFSLVPFISSAGLRVLALAMKKTKADGGSLELRNVSDFIREVFNTTGFSSIMKIV